MSATLKQLNPAAALRYFGMRQTIKGAIILGIFFGLLLAIQGIGYDATYPNESDRQKFAATMASTPSLGILYGEPEGLLTAEGYMVYRGVAAFGLIGSIWGLLVTTRLLRGAEEEGRWEVIMSGQTTARRAAVHILTGIYVSSIISFAISSFVAFGLCQLSGIPVSLSESLFINAAVFLPILIAVGLGAFVSQLALTRRRAVIYGLTAIIIAFTLRSIGNVLPDWYWLKNWTQFGWADQLRPIIEPHPSWLIPLVLTMIVLSSISVYLVGKRDAGTSFLHESQHATSRFYLLKNQWQLSLRLNLSVYIGWAVTVIVLSAIVASVAKVATEAVAESATLSQSIIQLSGGQKEKLVLAFIGAGVIFTATVLMIMAAVCMSLVRRDEAKQHAENILVQPIGKARWLISQLAIALCVIVATALLSNLCVLVVAHTQGIAIDAYLMVIGNLQLLGSVFIIIGIGSTFYGIYPRLAVPAMYIAIAWSFLVELFGSILTLSDVIKNSSLFKYISLVPAVDPDWSAFAWLTGISIILISSGVWLFTKRDYTAE